MQREQSRDSPNRKKVDLLEEREGEAWSEKGRETEFTEEERLVFAVFH